MAQRALGQGDRDALAKAFLFEGLAPEVLERICAMSAPRELEAAERLFTQGEPATHFFLVVSGEVALSRTAPNGAEKVIEINGPGRMFGEALMFMGGSRYPVNSQALSESRLVALSNRPFVEMIGASPDLCLRLLANLSVRLHRLIGDVESLTLQTAKERFVSFLLSLAPEQRDGALSIRLPFPKHVIASRLAIKPETFSRILHDLDERGVIGVQGAVIAVPDRDRLERLVRG